MSSYIRAFNDDKENQVFVPKQLHTPREKHHAKPIKKQFNTPPLNVQGVDVKNDRITLRNKQKKAPQVVEQRRTGLDARKSLKQQKHEPSHSQFQQRQPKVGNKLLQKLTNEFEHNDSKLEEFLKHEMGQDIELEITPTIRDPPLEDAPDDLISFQEIDLGKIYMTPFHTPDVQDECKLQDTLVVNQDLLKEELPWDHVKCRTPSFGLKSPRSGGTLTSTGGKSSGSSINKKRFMMGTKSSSIRKQQVQKNLLSKLIQECEDEKEEVEEQFSKSPEEEELYLELSDVDDDELKLMF